MGIVGIHSLFHPMLTFGTGVLLFILVWKGLPLVETHELRIGQWIAALSYIVSVQQPLTDISDRWNFFLAGLTSIERIREIFHERREIMGKRSPSRFQEISFSNLSFAYHDSERSALLNVNLTLQRGDWIGVYGESGSGKSTLLQMIYGFYRAESGSLSWNGNSYLDLDYAELRSHFGMVEQFPFLFTGSIGENISLFGEHPFEPSALRDEFKGFALIQDLLGKLDHPVNERGNNLSMGQKQMIAFLRAYLARADIWILDEATAFFDSEAEKEVLAALERLNSETHSITVIQVAHRPEALESMDRLIRMDQGRLHHHH
jgi:ATP-binding cassette subfamily B multidrug efflux pump